MHYIFIACQIFFILSSIGQLNIVLDEAHGSIKSYTLEHHSIFFVSFFGLIITSFIIGRFLSTIAFTIIAFLITELMKSGPEVGACIQANIKPHDIFIILATFF